MSSNDTSLVGRGREAMVPEQGLPFDVSRRRGRGPAPDAGEAAAPTDPAALRRETVAAVFDAVDWNAAAGPASAAVPEGTAPEAPALDTPARRYFAAFPWDGGPGRTTRHDAPGNQEPR